MTEKTKILIVDDDVSLCDTISDIFILEGYATQTSNTGEQAIEWVKREPFDVVLLDLLLPGINGIEVLKRVLGQRPETAVIMMSGHGTIDRAVEATQLGAYDWLEKPLKRDRILLSMRNVIRMRTLLFEKDHLLKECQDRYRMVGSSQALKAIYGMVDKVARQNTTILITGESGTGKELVARAIHLNSDRTSAPFIEVNCAAIPETLIESELFGHVKGSFTGATRDAAGKFQSAHGGTLFLDEIGDLTASAQAKILRALETGVVSRVGDNREEKVDVRLICATNKNLMDLIEEGLFREDLFHRINVIEIKIPPLKDRADDILPIARYFLELYANDFNKPLKKLSPNAEGMLLGHDWPGNVRELRNCVERLVVLVDDRIITGQHIMALLSHPALPYDYEKGKKYSDAKKEFERSYLLQALNSNHWNVTKTAKTIDMPRSLLYRKMDKYDLHREGPKVDG